MIELLERVIDEEIAMRKSELEKNYPNCSPEKKEDILYEYKSEVLKRLELKLEDNLKTTLLELHKMIESQHNYWVLLVRKLKIEA